MVLIWGTCENNVTYTTIFLKTLNKTKFQITISVKVLLQIYVSNGEKICIFYIRRLRVYVFGAVNKKNII